MKKEDKVKRPFEDVMFPMLTIEVPAIAQEVHGGSATSDCVPGLRTARTMGTAGAGGTAAGRRCFARRAEDLPASWQDTLDHIVRDLNAPARFVGYAPSAFIR